MSTDIGVKYTPQHVTRLPLSHEQLALELYTNAIKFVRIQWVDLINNVRSRVLPLSHFYKLLDTARPGIAVAKIVFGLVFIQASPGFNSVGEYLYVVDMSSFRRCPYAPGHAVVFGFFQEKVPVPLPTGPSFAVPLCPRTNLLRLVEYAAKDLGVQFLVGIETEFILLKSTNPIIAVNNHGWSNSPALASGTTEAKVLEEIADALLEAGIELQMYHSEAAPGQYEVITGPLSPLEAADALVQTRETIFNIASKHGLRATLAPRLSLYNGASGAHTHISVHGTQRGTSSSEFLNPLESCFLAGLLSHLPAVIAFTMPLPASYTRMMDGIWTGGTWACWGVDNREASVRLCNATSPSSRNFEIKSVDGTSSPYLSLTAILAAGIIGIRNTQELTSKNCDGPKAAAEMTDAERAAMGITKRLPLNIEEARRYLLQDDVLKDLLGPESVEVFVRVNEVGFPSLITIKTRDRDRLQTLGKAMEPQDGETDYGVMGRLIENY
ncbi:glutamate---ammonia ligase [Paxillus involutus ATCC 200175]|uniref:Glutamine synthetase n=1 Tax=Paxillus involutus ATCC 200175 TaxID=664439 RepID=A0A0C9STR9_PAXIN|nr:glutamate---ammonia ligase [Paxillus involutus ATCC 200175]